jgi:hypothetical protein
MTTETAAASMDPQVRAQMMRAARGIRHTPAEPVPMGIRYRTPAAPAQPAPVDRRPLSMTMASAGALEEIAEATPRQRTGTITRTTRPAAARTAIAPTSAPAETSPARPAPAKPRAARKPAPAAATAVTAPAPHVAEPPRPRVLGSYDAFACEACGSRYSQPFPDHEFGPLTPVTVTITIKTAGERA